MSENLTSRAFSEQLQSIFELEVSDAAPVALQLADVAETNISPEVEQFSLLFRGPRDASIPQGIHKLRHMQLGALQLFLVPLAPDALGTRFEAVFNRMRIAKP